MYEDLVRTQKVAALMPRPCPPRPRACSGTWGTSPAPGWPRWTPCRGAAGCAAARRSGWYTPWARSCWSASSPRSPGWLWPPPWAGRRKRGGWTHTWPQSCRTGSLCHSRGRPAPAPCTLFKICHSMLSTEWQDRTSCLSLVDIFFQNISLPLIGWHSCQLSACSPCSPGQCWTCSVTTWTIQLSKTKFPSRFVQKIKGVDGQCKSHVRVWLSNF